MTLKKQQHIKGGNMTQEELINKIFNLIDYFHYHNKNLTKEQWQKISELYHFLLDNAPKNK